MYWVRGTQLRANACFFNLSAIPGRLDERCPTGLGSLRRRLSLQALDMTIVCVVGAV